MRSRDEITWLQYYIELERFVTGVGILGIIVSKLCYRKKPCLIILFQVDKDPKIGFHCAILSLSLAVRLQVEGGRKFLLNA